MMTRMTLTERWNRFVVARRLAWRNGRDKWQGNICHICGKIMPADGETGYRVCSEECRFEHFDRMF